MKSDVKAVRVRCNWFSYDFTETTRLRGLILASDGKGATNYYLTRQHSIVHFVSRRL